MGVTDWVRLVDMVLYSNLWIFGSFRKMAKVFRNYLTVQNVILYY